MLILKFIGSSKLEKKKADNKRAIKVLHEKCKMAKQYLSQNLVTKVNVEFIYRAIPFNYNYRFSRDTLEELNLETFNLTIDLEGQVISDVKKKNRNEK